MAAKPLQNIRAARKCFCHVERYDASRRTPDVLAIDVGNECRPVQLFAQTARDQSDYSGSVRFVRDENNTVGAWPLSDIGPCVFESNCAEALTLLIRGLELAGQAFGLFR